MSNDSRLAAAIVLVGMSLVLAPDTQAQRLVEDLVLGTGERHETEDFYRSIGALTTDAEGRIFVSEYHGSDIRVYAENGDYIRTLGSRGAAPGEFRTINALGTTPDGRLVVLDQLNHRFTWFAPGLDDFEVAPVPGEAQLYARQLLSLSDSEFLLSQSSFRQAGPDPADHEWGLLHVHDRSFERTASFARISDFSPDDAMGKARIRAGFRYLYPLVLGPDSVLASEEYYPGYVTLFVREKGAWAKAGRWEGTPVRRRYRVLDADPGTDWRELPWESIPSGWSGPGGSWQVDIWSATRGLALSQEGTVLHFAYIFDGRQGTFGVEEFDRRGQLIKYHRLQSSRKGHEDVPLAGATVLHQDAQGRIYFLGGQDGVPVVRRMRWESGR